jgi:hypothetical protein
VLFCHWDALIFKQLIAALSVFQVQSTWRFLFANNEKNIQRKLISKFQVSSKKKSREQKELQKANYVFVFVWT